MGSNVSFLFLFDLVTRVVSHRGSRAARAAVCTPARVCASLCGSRVGDSSKIKERMQADIARIGPHPRASAARAFSKRSAQFAGQTPGARPQRPGIDRRASSSPTATMASPSPVAQHGHLPQRSSPWASRALPRPSPLSAWHCTSLGRSWSRRRPREWP